MNAGKAIEAQRRREDLLRRHMLRALVYEEAKRVFRTLSYFDMPDLDVPFKPVHYYMHLLPGFNTHFVPAKFVGWRRLRAVDVTPHPERNGDVRFSLNADYLRKRDW